ncbi:hypothetical protein [Bifidobacterium simiarum]|uniref:Uncharacterized protein n=1 Tax=Bifidobacterium simiarum TaxID=2045441 RepID=A0A2M9HDD6_9BIFI|nr:hypothetical protein [Bifidobacterium simiarum]PJM74829.1 hypothetical protein CSQ87_07735 [Bifidobacterium simiarum]
MSSQNPNNVPSSASGSVAPGIASTDSTATGNVATGETAIRPGRRTLLAVIIAAAVIIMLAVGMGFAFAATRGAGHAASATPSGTTGAAASTTSQSSDGSAADNAAATDDAAAAGSTADSASTSNDGTASSSAASAAVSGAKLLEHADQACNPHVNFTGSTATESLVGESGGKTLTLMSGKDSDKRTYQCAVRETRVPQSVLNRVKATGMNDGLQSASWDGVTMTWSVNDNVGVQLMFAAGR